MSDLKIRRIAFSFEGAAFMSDPAILAEARAFRAQEGIHAHAHRQHIKALIMQYPALQSALDQTIASYDKLYASKPFAYHLA
jgi:predicted metal-dependent hydrolase